MHRTINMRSKMDTTVFYLSQGRKAIYLKTTTVSQYRFIPVYEFVNSPKSSNSVCSGPQVKMVCVAEKYLSAHLFQFICRYCFDCPSCCNRYKGRGMDCASRCFHEASPCITVCLYNAELHVFFYLQAIE